MRPSVLLVSIMLFLMLIAGCRQAPTPGAALQIQDTVTSIGGLDSQGLRQSYSYEITVKNTGSNSVYIQSLHPVLEPSVANYVLTPDLELEVGRTVPAGDSCCISGSFVFDGSQLSKSQIISLRPFFKSVSITTSQNVPLPNFLPETRVQSGST